MKKTFLGWSEELENAAEKNKGYYDGKITPKSDVIVSGNFVMVKTIRKKNGLDPQMFGPLRVVEWVSETSIRVESIDGKKLRIHPIVNVNRVRKTLWRGRSSMDQAKFDFYASGEVVGGIGNVDGLGLGDVQDDDAAGGIDDGLDAEDSVDADLEEPGPAIQEPPAPRQREPPAPRQREPPAPRQRKSQEERLNEEAQRYFQTKDVQRHYTRQPPTGY